MIRRVALVLALGGWVCHHDGDNPCVGATTCTTDVGDACCPLDTYFYCGTCRNTVEECASEVYVCEDESTLLDCSFDGEVSPPNCIHDGVGWRLQALGTVRGCGGETVVFSVNGHRLDTGVDCGAWHEQFGGCTPNQDAISEIQFAIDAHIDGDVPHDLVISRGHGSVPQIVATSVTCP